MNQQLTRLVEARRQNDEVTRLFIGSAPLEQMAKEAAGLELLEAPQAFEQAAQKQGLPAQDWKHGKDFTHHIGMGHEHAFIAQMKAATSEKRQRLRFEDGDVIYLSAPEGDDWSRITVQKLPKEAIGFF